ncbi:6-carboxytetrahydropterin synthase QueD [Candidatus Saganbacteria bacterium]|uniref:6-carboxy-5,6,7,8-tetrahydropterin synthase n=1 Tax=Candidatus Saganbacteria bacterium TaxID=2575572 RepID=A0A9D6UJV6_UNCSA|nr:6-carboxytetrahydropterin synthase QueD [Candidatus Saganbacteria bacterium]
MFELMVEDTFDAAHALRGYSGPCENLHGHTWKVQVFLKGKKLNALGLLEDFKLVKKELEAAISEFDHKLLNDLASFAARNPSCENLAEITFKKLKKRLKMLSKVTVWESSTTYASYY